MIHTLEAQDNQFVQFILNVTYNQLDDMTTYRSPKHLNMHIVRSLADEPLPVIVWIVGGGFYRVNKDYFLPQLVEFARRGYFVASIEYRITSEAHFPAQLEDVKSAIRFLRANADKYKIDPDRIGVWGESAGGNLAALLGTTAHVPELEGTGDWQGYSSRVQAVVDWYGPTDMTLMPVHTPHPSLYVGASVREHPEKAAKVNPITYITPDVPPFLIMHGDQDTVVPIACSDVFYEALQKAGADVTYYRVKGSGHGAVGFSQPQILNIVQDWFDAKLKGIRTPANG